MINFERMKADAEMTNEKGQKAATSDPTNFENNLQEQLLKTGNSVKNKVRERGRWKFIPDHCPFDSSHTGKDSAFFLWDDGTPGFKCHHNSCADKHWKDVAQLLGLPFDSQFESNDPEQESIDASWEYAKGAFPYQPDFPWGVFPSAIADSLQACAESCATSPISLAGTAFAILASALGRTLAVSPKTSWIEPCHVWFADIRPSGEGKTPAMQLLAHVLHKAQAQSDRDFEHVKELWEQTTKKDRGPEPKWNRSYFVTGLTMEGIRTALQEGHGGIVCLLNELSSFITGQGQYKSGKGDDREAWLTLHDGSAARILRAGQSLTIHGARVSICGGIQPEVFQAVFGDKGGLFLTDGTIFRFLLTYEHAGNYELTRATWSEQHRETWERLVNRALRWADTRFQSGNDPLVLKLSDEAWDCFSDFRNSTFSVKDHFPPAFLGFIPKAASYVLRIAGLLHCIDEFSVSDDIHPVINAETIQKTIATVTFYLGHTLEALRLLNGEKTSIRQDDTRKYIIAALESLTEKAEGKGHLSVKDIADTYNALTGRNETPHKIGKLLRRTGFIPKQDSHSGTYRIPFSEIQKFLKTKSAKSASPQHSDNVDDILADIEKQKSASPPVFYGDASNVRTLRTLKKESPPKNIPCFSTVADFADIADFKPKQTEKTGPDPGDIREVVL